MRDKLKIVLALFILIPAISCGKKQESAKSQSTVVRGVRIETVRASQVEDSYEATGTVRSKTRSVISSKVMGGIVAMRVHEGDPVRAGQVLVEIDSRDAGTEVKRARAGLRESQDALDEVDRSIRAAESKKQAAEANRTLASSTLSRYQKLFERGSVSPQEFDEVRTRYEVAAAEAQTAGRMAESLSARRNQMLARIDQAKADVTGAQINVGYSRITSPISGIVVSKQADVGYMAAPGAPLLTIESNSSYRLETSVEESQIGKIQQGALARVFIDALGEHEMTGVVDEIVPASDPASRSYTVKIRIPTEVSEGGSPSVRSGLFGKARFVTGQEQALTIPQSSIVERGQLSGVYVVDAAGVARLRLIKTGRIYGDRVAVLSGLTEGEEIVTEGVETVSDGSRVREDKAIQNTAQRTN